MTPLEELQTAYERLRALRDDHDSFFRETDSFIVPRLAAYHQTLHRTIEAQLQFLGHAAGRACRYQPGPNATIVQAQIRNVEPDALSLARAINGEAS